jgi:hypothetical protein
VKRVRLRVPFASEGDWEGEIDRSVDRDIERLREEAWDPMRPPCEDDRELLKALEAKDIDYETIFQAAAPEYVEQFSKLASADLGVDLDLRFETFQCGPDTAIGASMPIAVARKLLQVMKKNGVVGRGTRLDDMDADDWGDLLEHWLPNADDLEERIFSDMAEATNSFCPL